MSGKNALFDMLDKNTKALGILCEVENALKLNGAERQFLDHVAPIRDRILKQQRELLAYVDRLPSAETLNATLAIHAKG